MSLGGSFGDFGIVLFLKISSRLDRDFLMILSPLLFFGAIVEVVGNFL